MGETNMRLTLQQKKGLYWGITILAIVVLMSTAWAQINMALTRCFSVF
jgi:uncharacterized membrane protein (DUF441 family)